MSAFTESVLVKKLVELNSSQQSIQTLSLWLIHHRKHHSNIVKSWYKELQKITKNKKLTFMYLANDVIQNSKRKGPEYGKEFGRFLPKAFSHIGEVCMDEKTLGSLGRIINIWEERGVYDAKLCQEYRNALNRMADEMKTPKSTTPPIATPEAVVEVKESNEKPEPKKELKRKGETGGAAAGGGGTPPIRESKKHKSSSSHKERGKRETVEVNGKVETHLILSPQTPAGDPPEPEELIKALVELENSASSDAVVRERIANLPPEVSEVSLLSKLEDKEQAAKLAGQVSDAATILHEYNARLCLEMEDRKKLTTMLKDFQTEQRELLAQAEQRYQEYMAKLQKVRDVQKEIRNHLNNLPDLTQLPDVTGGLAPLPSAGDLFNIH